MGLPQKNARCPHCFFDLTVAPPDETSGRPRHGNEALVTFIGAIPYHSGHCEAVRLSQLKKKSVWITAFPMPLDLEARYGGAT
jgi:hypothetical protein